MEKYKLNIGKDIEFILEVGEESTRWGDEGINQPIFLVLNGIIVFISYWGKEDVINKFKYYNPDNMVVDIFIDSSNKKISFKSPDMQPITLNGDYYDNFMIWLNTCLLPIEEQREIKLKKIIERGT